MGWGGDNRWQLRCGCAAEPGMQAAMRAWDAGNKEVARVIHALVCITRAAGGRRGVGALRRGGGRTLLPAHAALPGEAAAKQEAGIAGRSGCSCRGTLSGGDWPLRAAFVSPSCVSFLPGRCRPLAPPLNISPALVCVHAWHHAWRSCKPRVTHASANRHADRWHAARLRPRPMPAPCGAPLLHIGLKLQRVCQLHLVINLPLCVERGGRQQWEGTGASLRSGF